MRTQPLSDTAENTPRAFLGFVWLLAASDFGELSEPASIERLFSGPDLVICLLFSSSVLSDFVTKMSQPLCRRKSRFRNGANY